jgi:two-component system LytT family sensor kinase
VIITLTITNSIYLSQRLLSRGAGHTIRFLLVYYGASLLGLLVAIEAIHLAMSFIFGTPYVFFHTQDFLFSLVIMIIVCTALYVRGMQKQQFVSMLNAKELDVLRLTQQNTHAQLAALQARINPHFLYNALNAIASLIHDNPGQAEAMTLKLSELFRHSVNRDMENTISVSEEMEIVNIYFDIERVRFGKRIDFITAIDPALANVKIPRFLLQPLVENALKHGLKNITKNGWLKISIEEKTGIEIAVADNGAPFPDDYEAGYGLQSTYDKLALLYPGNYEIYIRNQPVKEVRIIIPRSNG